MQPLSNVLYGEPSTLGEEDNSLDPVSDTWAEDD